jgi:hypothetical protein
MDFVPPLETLQDAVRDRPRTVGGQAEFGLDLFSRGTFVKRRNSIWLFYKGRMPQKERLVEPGMCLTMLTARKARDTEVDTNEKMEGRSSDMPRQARLDPPGSLHHVMIRRIEKGKIVDDRKDRQGFVVVMGKTALETEIKIYSFALITNVLLC